MALWIYRTPNTSSKSLLGTSNIQTLYRFTKIAGVEDAPVEIQLQRGFRVALTAKNSVTRQRLKEDLYAVMGLPEDPKWELKKTGMLVSGVLPKRKFYLRVMQCTDDQPTLFSEMIKVEPSDGSRVLLRDVLLYPGTKLEGTLDASVKRPVKNGYVVGQVGIQLDDDDQNEDLPRGVWRSFVETNWGWSDKARIKEDGSFVFESLPQDVVWQMIPICDDWVAVPPELESVADHFPNRTEDFERNKRSYCLPQIAKLSGDKTSTTLKMIPTDRVTATFVGSDGKPESGIKAVRGPRLFWLDSGWNAFGITYKSRDYLVARRRGEKPEPPLDNRLSYESDANGICELSLPPMLGRALLIYRDQFDYGSNVYVPRLEEGERKKQNVKKDLAVTFQRVEPKRATLVGTL